ncbi:MAG: hypothetical protein NPIRA04_17310 [Nitrospirales bacterium]|nr:MAG: hypothetical protein NPIRA04_17310 [Nitrospirales bacterium]
MAKRSADEMRSEYDFSQLKNSVKGKYYSRAKADTNLVLIDPDLAKVFPNGESVNRALRLLLQTASDATAALTRTRKRIKNPQKARPKKPTRVTPRH